jgi:acetolactate synthase-1/2/3 large subunit
MRLSGAEILIHILREQGVDTIFGYPGGAVLAIYDALYEHRDEITHYLTAHEQGAAHAADGYARATGKVGVVLATSGPGSTNLVTGIATAFMDSVPLVAITGNVGSTLIGKDSFQEVYTTGITLPVTKHNFFVQEVNELASVLREAFFIASDGRPGPVLVDITKDAQAAYCEWTPRVSATDAAGEGLPPIDAVAGGVAVAGGDRANEPSALFTSADIDATLAALAASRYPLILFGGGVVSADASLELQDLIHTTQIPTVHSIMGTGILDPDDKLNVGLAGMHGHISANRALAKADFILTLGFRFSDRVALDTEHWASQARVIQIDIDRSEVDKNIEVDQALIGDARAVLRALLGRMRSEASENTSATREPQTVREVRDTGGAGSTDDTRSAGDIDSTGGAGCVGGANGAGEPPRENLSLGFPVPDSWRVWLARIEAWRANDYHPADSDSVLKPHQIIGAINKLAGPNLILTTDVGQHQMWAAQYCGHIKPRGFLTSGGLGTMGFGYGAAIGAQIGAGGGSARARPVIHITGDGSFHMNLNEACTAVSYRLPIITVIFNNQVLGMVRQWQKTFYEAHYSATTLDRLTDYMKVAEGFGATGMRATTIAEFRSAFADALVTNGPVWIECVIDRDEQVLPMIPAGGGVDDTVVN